MGALHSTVSLFSIMFCVHNPCVFHGMAIRLEHGFSTGVNLLPGDKFNP